jgi:hypothetical protein
MRKQFALILCVVCLSGCAGFRQHWADGPGNELYCGTGKTLRYAPTYIVAGAAVAAWDHISDPFKPDDDDFDE